MNSIPRALIIGDVRGESLPDFQFTWRWNPTSSSPPKSLRDLIDAAKSAELQHRFLAWSRSTVADIDELPDIRELAPRDILVRLDSPGAGDQPMVAFLKRIAAEVEARPTVFCIGAVCNASKPIQDTLQRLAVDIARLSAAELLKREFTFAPLHRDPDSKKGLQHFVGLVIRESTSVGPEGLDGRPGPVLLVGPTGTGKTELAHHIKAEKTGGFVKVNIGAISEGMIESRMRGFKKGAFTGAVADAPGWFESANNGILFLDEFQNAPMAAQVQLLDLLSAVSDQVEVAPMGADAKPSTYEVRVVLAANEPLHLLLAEKRLRPDLFHRVRVVHELQPLAERLSGEERKRGLLERLVAIYRWKSNRAATDPEAIRDLTLLFPSFNQEVLAELAMHTWPGNLRELERVCFDLNWKRETSFEPDVNFVRQQLHRIGSTDGKSQLRPAPSIPTSELSRLRRAEKILLDHNLDVAAASVRLGEVRLKTPHHLRTYLRKNVSSLSEEFKAHPQASQLLAGRPRHPPVV